MTFVLTFVDNVRTRIVRVGFFLYFEIIIEHVWIEEIKKKLWYFKVKRKSNKHLLFNECFENVQTRLYLYAIEAFSLKSQGEKFYFNVFKCRKKTTFFHVNL